jgi:hypothetical protein
MQSPVPQPTPHNYAAAVFSIHKYSVSKVWYLCAPINAVLQEFPSEYDTAIRQAQLATKAALADGLKLLEVEFPVSGLAASQGANR